MDLQEPLFSKASVFDVVSNQERALRHELGSLDKRALLSRSDEEILTEFSSKYRLELPVLKTLDMVADESEVDIDVRYDPSRFVIDRSRPVYIRGTQFTFTIPFEGDADLFQVRPSTFNSNPPRGEVGQHEIRLGFRQIEPNAASIKTDLYRTLDAINQHLGWLSSSISDFNARLPAIVGEEVTRRRHAAEATQSMLAELGIPVRSPQPAEVPLIEAKADEARSARAHQTARKKEWDVFICHASEDKDEIARPLAEILENSGVGVWYDETSLKLGDSLRASIDHGLASSRFGVVILSQRFFEKHWPIQELNGLTTREVEGKKVILPVWHKIDHDGVAKFSPILADKLAVRTSEGLDVVVKKIIEVLHD